MSGVPRILADSKAVSECQLDPLSGGSGCCSPSFAGPSVVNSVPAPSFAAIPASFAYKKAEDAVRSFIQSQKKAVGVLSTVVIPLGKSRNRRKGAAPKRAASEEDEVKQPVEKKKKLGVAKPRKRQRATCKQGRRQAKPGMSAQEAVLEMQRRMASRAAAKKRESNASRKSPAFYRSFPLVFGHNCMQCTS